MVRSSSAASTSAGAPKKPPGRTSAAMPCGRDSPGPSFRSGTEDVAGADEGRNELLRMLARHDVRESCAAAVHVGCNKRSALHRTPSTRRNARWLLRPTQTERTRSSQHGRRQRCQPRPAVGPVEETRQPPGVAARESVIARHEAISLRSTSPRQRRDRFVSAASSR